VCYGSQRRRGSRELAIDFSPRSVYASGMAKKSPVKTKDFWASVETTLGKFDAGEDEVSRFLAQLKVVKNEPTHEV